MEQEYRVRELTLEGEMGEKMMENLSNYALNQIQKERLDEIDTKLTQLASSDNSGLSLSLIQRLNEAQIEAEAEMKSYGTSFDDNFEEQEDNQKVNRSSISKSTKKKGSKASKAKTEVTNAIHQNQIERARKEYISQLDKALDSVKK